MSEFLVNLSIKQPKVALIFLPLAAWIIYTGLADAKFAAATQSQPIVPMRVEAIYNVGIPYIFPRYRAAGQTGGGETVVPISSNECQRLEVGDTLEIVATDLPRRPFITRSSLETQLGWIRFSIGGIPFNDAMIFGCMGGLLSISWAFLGRWLTSVFSQSLPQNRDNRCCYKALRR